MAKLWGPWIATLAAWVAWTASVGLRENDTFWHLGLGRAVLREGSRVVREPWALPEFPARCVVPEWLWDVLSFALYGAGGFVLLHVFVLACGASVAVAIGVMLRVVRPEASFGPSALVALLATLGASSRIGERPEILAMAFAACAIALAARFVEAPEQRTRAAVALVVLELVWAQIHGTFVLVLCITGAFLVVRTARTRRLERADVVLMAALFAGLFSSAHGSSVFSYLLDHARGDAVEYILDMQATPWEKLNPRRAMYGPIFLLLCFVGLLGACLARRVDAAHLLLALGGVLLVKTAVRGLGLGSVLLAPFALDGASAIASLFDRLPGRKAWAVALPVTALLVASWRVEARDGPFGRVGLADEHFPIASAAWLARAPERTRVLTTFAAGAPIGFLREGRVRTYVDSRTPMYFDDTDYGVSRDLLTTPEGVVRAVQRYGFEAAVVRRDLPACESVARSGAFVPVLIEPKHTTFARVGTPLAATALSTLNPCGPSYVLDESCARDAEPDLRSVAKFDARFAGFLRATRAVHCREPLNELGNWLPEEDEAHGYREARNFVLGEAFIAIRAYQKAIDTLEPQAFAGDLRAAWLLVHAYEKTHAPARQRELLGELVEQLSDATPPALRAALGLACAELRDFACARFHGVRAAAAGEPSAAPVLERIAAQGPEAMRAEARRWLSVLPAR